MRVNLNMKIWFKQIIVMYFLCISLVLCYTSCDGRSIIPSRTKPSDFMSNVEPSSVYQSMFPIESSHIPSYQYPMPTVQPNYYQIPNTPSYPTSFDYQSPQFSDRLQENWNSWNQYQSPLNSPSMGSGLSLSDLIGRAGSYGTGSSSYGGASTYDGISSLRLPSSLPRQPEIVITEFPSRYDKFESPFYPSMNPDMGKYMPSLYGSGYGKASASSMAQAGSMPNIPSSYPGYGSLDTFNKPSLSGMSGLRRNLGNDDSVNGGTKATESSKSVASEAKSVESDSRRFLSSETKAAEDKKTVASNENNKSATTNNSNAQNTRRSNTQNGNAAESKNVAEQQQAAETAQNDNFEIDTRLDFTSLNEDATPNDKVQNKSQ